MKQILIAGGGFAGLNAAKILGKRNGIKVTVIDRNNHHLFQPLLYQVATAGLSPAEIAVPVRSLLSKYTNTRVLQGNIESIDLQSKKLHTEFGIMHYDYLVIACGVQHSYFTHTNWERHAPGLKTLEQATEIRRRILSAFELAEREKDPEKQKMFLTFVIIGGGPTGVELAGAIGEMSRFTLVKDFKRINPASTRIILMEAGPRILPDFSEKLANKAAKDLENLGVQIWILSTVTHVYHQTVFMGNEKMKAATILWAAGIQAPRIRIEPVLKIDDHGRILVNQDLSIEHFPEVFVAGDQAHFSYQTGKPLPGVAPVAMQQGGFVAKNILRELNGRERKNFHYINKGQLATIGKNKAIAEIGNIQVGGFFAWLVWLFVHIYYIIGFNNRLFIFLKWATHYITNRKGARLITGKNWRFYDSNNS